jgi:two-component system sensor histidine kinase KdpD
VDRPNALVGNLLDLSRLRAGALYVHAQPVDLDAVAAEAVAGLGYASHQVDLCLPDTLPPVLADAALPERVLANLDNAVRPPPIRRARCTPSRQTTGWTSTSATTARASRSINARPCSSPS